MSIELSEKTIERVNALIIGWAVAFFVITGIIVLTLSGPEAYAATVKPRHEPGIVHKAPPVGVRLYPCKLEDGSGKGQKFPCYWDAGQRGNGIGHSFWISKRHKTFYLPHD